MVSVRVGSRRSRSSGTVIPMMLPAVTKIANTIGSVGTAQNRSDQSYLLFLDLIRCIQTSKTIESVGVSFLS